MLKSFSIFLLLTSSPLFADMQVIGSGAPENIWSSIVGSTITVNESFTLHKKHSDAWVLNGTIYSDFFDIPSRTLFGIGLNDPYCWIRYNKGRSTENIPRGTTWKIIGTTAHLAFDGGYRNIIYFVTSDPEMKWIKCQNTRDDSITRDHIKAIFGDALLLSSHE